MADPRDMLEAALFALPKPIDRDAVLAQARTTLTDGSLVIQFERWFAVNGDTLLRKLNG